MSGHTTTVRRGALGLILALTLSVAFSGPASGQDPRVARDCTLPPTGKVPMTDLGADTYMGAQGGLYPQGSNTVPDSHLAVGLARAAMIQPRNEAGEPDPDGVVVLASIGFSNPAREFAEFQPLAANHPTIDPAFRTVNLAQGGQHVFTWASPNGRPWDNLPVFLEREGFTAEQVQAVWMKQVQRVSSRPIEPFPNGPAIFRNALADIVVLLQERFPNLQIVYLSSRVYGGWNEVSSPSPEPFAYEEGFGVKWLIEDQIAGDAALNADPTAGELIAPWLAWGPYLWADGTNPRSDGLTWECTDFRASDGAHLNDSGNPKVATMLMDFLENEPTAAWAFTDRTLPDPPQGAVPPPTSTIPGVTETPPATGDEAPERRERRRDRGETTPTRQQALPNDAAPATTTAPSEVTAGRQESPRNDDLPPLAWALIGSGATLAVLGAGMLLWRMRRSSPGAERDG